MGNLWGKPHSIMSDSGSPPPKKMLIEPNQLSRMFLDGSLSDVTIKAFNKAWNLHKNILAANSPYFMSLFTKDWKDSKEKIQHLQIPDQKVTVDALHSCLQSMYAFEVEFTKANVIPLLAAATFLQLDDQIQNCYEFMIESMEMHTVIDYLSILETYGNGKSVENAAFECLENCLIMVNFQMELSKIDIELMTQIAASGNLFCIDEDSLYGTMILWLYTKVTGQSFEENESDTRVKACDYFEHLAGSTPFLLTDAGRQYLDAFRQIRIRDLLITNKTVSKLQRENIFPDEWIEKASIENWKRIKRALSINSDAFSQDENYFVENSVRCGASYLNFQPFSKIFSHALLGLELMAEKSENKWIFKIERTKVNIVPLPDEMKEMLFKGRVVKKAQNGKILFTLSSGIKKTFLKVGDVFEVLLTEEKLDDYIVDVSINYLF